ncbi:putative UDP-glucose lipid carrier transferase [Mycobacteriaceae bacterium]
MGSPARAANLRRVKPAPRSRTTITSANPAAMRAAGASTAGWQSTYARFLALSDLVVIVVAVGIAQWVRFGSLPSGGALPLMRSITYLEVSVAIAFGWMVALTINGARSTRVIGSGVEEYRRVWWATISVFGTVAIISMLFKLELARGYLMVALPLGVIGLLASRWLARRVVVRLRKQHGRCVTRLLVVGSPQAVRDLTLGLSREPWSGYDIVGACIPGQYSRDGIGIPGFGTVPVLGNEESVARAVVASGSHAVAVAATEQFHGTGLRELSWELENLDVDLLVAPGVVDVAGPRLHMRPVAGLPLIHVEKPQYHGAKRFQKRAFDIAFSGLALLLGLPLLLLIALAVKLTSRGPVFYRQERIGLDGTPFEMIKFRTMVVGADAMLEQVAHLNESDSGVLFKIRKDPRVTPLGRFLRKYSLDELPQFINAFTGEMSVVGPRPPLESEVASYDDHTMRRLLVKPGITGLWQVSGRSDLSWEDSVRLDMFYVENWSIMADIVIALKTVRVMFNHSGSY